jgi:hypothetical protein
MHTTLQRCTVLQNMQTHDHINAGHDLAKFSRVNTLMETQHKMQQKQSAECAKVPQTRGPYNLCFNAMLPSTFNDRKPTQVTASLRSLPYRMLPLCSRSSPEPKYTMIMTLAGAVQQGRAHPQRDTRVSWEEAPSINSPHACALQHHAVH